MKRFVLILFAIFTCVIANAEQITINWLNEDKTINQITTCTVGGDVVMPNNIPQKRGYIFKGYVDNYTPVEYIESTGSQYIDTGYYANQNTGVKTKINITRLTYVYSGLFGGYPNKSFGFIYGNRDNDNFVFGNQIMSIPKRLTTGNNIDILINKNMMSYNMNDNQYGVSAPGATFKCSYTFLIFTAKDTGSGTNMPALPYKLYYFQIYDNDVLVRDFIPVVDSRGVACLYDKVEHKFYYNAGSGEFIAGPEIQ